MKKVITALCTALLVVVFAFALTGCSKADKIKKAYESNDYTVTTVSVKDSAEAKTALKALGFTDDQVKEAESWEVISASKVTLVNGGTALVIKFPSSGKVKEFLTVEKDDGSKDTAAYDKAKEDGRINGDCLLLLSTGGGKEIFQKA